MSPTLTLVGDMGTGLWGGLPGTGDRVGGMGTGHGGGSPAPGVMGGCPARSQMGSLGGVGARQWLRVPVGASRVGGAGGWSARGCEIAFRNRSHVSCQCHHLTSFAVLMDISRREVGHGGHGGDMGGQEGDTGGGGDLGAGPWRGDTGRDGAGRGTLGSKRCHVVGRGLREGAGPMGGRGLSKGSGQG